MTTRPQIWSIRCMKAEALGKVKYSIRRICSWLVSIPTSQPPRYVSVCQLFIYIFA